MRLYLLQAISENLKGALNPDARGLYRSVGSVSSKYIYQIPWDHTSPTAYFPFRAKLLKRKPNGTLPVS